MENYLEKEKTLKRYYIALGIYELFAVISSIGSIILYRFIKADAPAPMGIGAISTMVLTTFLAISFLKKSPKLCGYAFALLSIRSFLSSVIAIIKGEFEAENIKGLILIAFYILLAYGFLNIDKIKKERFTVAAIGSYFVYGIVTVSFDIFEQFTKDSTFSNVAFFSSFYIVNFVVSIIFYWFVVKIIVTENELSD